MAGELFSVRSKFVEKVTKAVIKQLLDDILEDGIINDGEKESIVEENTSTSDKARALIDTVKKKGDVASWKLIAHIKRRDGTLYSEVGLSSGQPAPSAAPAPAVEPLPSTTNMIAKDEAANKDNDGEIYPVTQDSISNRVALLITNIKFTNENFNRAGAEKDEMNMEKLLTVLGYEVVKHTNLTGKEGGSVIVCDGANSAVLCDDVKQPSPPLPADDDIEEDVLRCVHKEKDFISLLSSTPDTVSYRHPVYGSYLIQYIAEIVNIQSAHAHDVEVLFRKVMKRFEGTQNSRQMPTKDRCTLTKPFYFFPGP